MANRRILRSEKEKRSDLDHMVWLYRHVYLQGHSVRISQIKNFGLEVVCLEEGCSEVEFWNYKQSLYKQVREDYSEHRRRSAKPN